ncbi:hypothetical protein MKW94_024924, partial [Papaver nudicaule]|nr:hypothetical protein [Papaver nudicaule]
CYRHAVKNFPDNRGTLLGLQKGFTGLSGAIMTQIYLAIYGNDSKSLIMLIAWLPAVISIFFIHAIRLIKVIEQSNADRRVLYKYLLISVVFALFIMVIIITQKLKTFSHAEYVHRHVITHHWRFCGLGTSLTAIDNLGQIGESLYPTLTISTFVSLTSIWSYFGRVCAGLISDILLAKWKFPRTFVLAVILFVSCVGHILIAFPIPGSLYIASVIIGFCYGAHVTLLFTVISELFGLKFYSTLFNCGILAMPFGSYVFNVRVAGFLYDKEALKQLKLMGLGMVLGKELTCIGIHCYRHETTVANSRAATTEPVSPMDSNTKCKVSPAPFFLIFFYL